MNRQPRVAVIGGGISGLMAARAARARGADVVLLEASDRLGGQIRTRLLDDGIGLDVGAEALHLGAASVGRLLDDLGLRETMIVAGEGASESSSESAGEDASGSPRRPLGSWLWTSRGLRPLPRGVGPAGPTRLRPVLASGALSVAGLARAAAEPLRAATTAPLAEGADVAVGAFVRSRFGREVADTFVDPLLGSLHAGDVSRLSLRACTPSLVPAAVAGQSVVRRTRALRRRGVTPPPMSFVTWTGGLVEVVSALVRELAAAGVPLRTGTSVTALTRLPDGSYRLSLATGDGEARESLDCAAVVLAVPARHAGALLRDLVPGASAALERTETASVATLLLGYPAAAVADVPALRGTGVLIPSRFGTLGKAATFLSTKWPHLSRHTAAGGLYWLRVSAGRAGDHRLGGLDDAALLDHVRRDLRAVTGLDAAPAAAHIQRWPNAMPQLTVGHLDRLGAARAALAALTGDRPGASLALAGASYDGIGIASCLTSAVNAAAAIATHLDLEETP